jgi:hypothetical protein
MLPLTRILCLAAASVLVALTATSIPAHAKDLDQSLGSVGHQERPVAECHLLKRAISRRACEARREMKIDPRIDTAEKK